MMVFRSSSIRVGLAFGILFFALIFLASASVSVEAKSLDTTTDLDFELANELELMESMDVDELIAHTESLKSQHSLAYPPSVPPDFNWHTQNRSLGMCAMYGTCPGDPLNRVVNCPYNVPAVMVRQRRRHMAAWSIQFAPQLTHSLAWFCECLSSSPTSMSLSARIFSVVRSVVTSTSIII